MQNFIEYVKGFQKSRIFLTAFELGVFTEINDTEKTAKQVALKINTDINATERLMNALCALNSLVKVEDKFKNTADGIKYLCKQSPDYMSIFHHSNHSWDTWSDLTEVVKKGKPAENKKIEDKESEWLEAFIGAMHNRGKKQAEFVAKNFDLTDINSLLDIGGGSGVFSMAIKKIKPQIKATIFDLQNVIPITEKYLTKEGFQNQIMTLSGNYKTENITGTYDLILLSAIIHSNSFEENNELIKKCFKALNSGGKIIIQDYIMNDSKTQPAAGAIFSLNMLVATDNGTCFSEKEIKQWFDNSGIKFLIKKETPFIVSQIIGIKI